MGTATIAPKPEPIVTKKQKTPREKEKEKKEKRKAKTTGKPTKIPPGSKKPRWARILKTAGINTIGSQVIVAGQGDQYIYIAMIVFTCNDEGDITLSAGQGTISGPMSFGGTDEPRGVVIDHSKAPIVIAPGQAFSISVAPAPTKTPTVAGYVTYYTLPIPSED